MNIVFVDVESEESEAACGGSADDVQEDEGFRNEVEIRLFVLVPEQVLQVPVVVLAQQLEEPEDGLHHRYLGAQSVLLTIGRQPVALRSVRLISVHCNYGNT